LAERQCSVFARWQVLAAGGSDPLTRRRLVAGRWIQPDHAVYGFPGRAPSYRRSLWIALLGVGPHAVVSHWAAGAIHGLAGFPPTRFTLVVPHGSYGRTSIAVVHRTCAPPVPVIVDGFPVTSVERTLVDLGKVVGPRRLGTALDDAVVTGKCRLAAVQRTFLDLARSGRKGITTMRMVLDARGEAYVPPRSELERLLDGVLATIPVEVTHEAPLPGREWSNERVDRIVHAPRRLIVEADGRKWHARMEAMARDHERDRDNLRAGYPTVRYCWDELRHHRQSVRDELLALLVR
jgi:hypothetical protein